MSPHTARVWRWIGVVILALVLLMALSLAIALRHARRHSDWPERLAHVRLEPARPLLGPADIATNNAFFFIRQITNCAVKLDAEEWECFQTNGWTAGAFTNLENALTAAAPCIALLQTAAGMKDGQVESTVSITQTMRGASAYLKLSKLQAFAMARSFEEGRPAEGLAIERQLLANNAHMEKGACLIGRLIVLAVDKLVAEQLHRALVTGYLPAEQLPAADQLLRDRNATREPWAEAVRYEMLTSLDAIDIAYQDNLNGAASLAGDNRRDPRMRALAPVLRLVGSNAAGTRRRFEAVYSHLIDLADKPREARAFEQTNVLFTGNNPYRGPFLFDDPIGHILAALLLPALSTASERHQSVIAYSDALRVMLGVESHRARHGTLPAQLEQLVPEFLDALPRDPFQPDHALRFTRDDAGYTVYSVGPNGSDEHGAVKKDDATGKSPADVGWRFERAAP